MPDTVPLELRWAARLRELGRQLRSAPDLPPGQDARGELWAILQMAISRYLRRHSHRLGSMAPEDLEDLAAQKSLELARRLDSDEWDLAALEVPEIPRILSTVARNAIVDRIRQSSRRPPAATVDVEDVDTSAVTGGGLRPADAPSAELERREFAEALRRCTDTLEARSRLVWLLRVLHDLSTKEIAAHPEVRLKTAHVDVLLQRTRKLIRECMKRSGYEPSDMPPGTFTVLWRTFRLRTVREAVVST